MWEGAANISMGKRNYWILFTASTDMKEHVNTLLMNEITVLFIVAELIQLDNMHNRSLDCLTSVERNNNH